MPVKAQQVDLLEEVVYWDSDDFWSCAALAAAAWIRAVADDRSLALAELVRRLRDAPETLAMGRSARAPTIGRVLEDRGAVDRSRS